MFARINKTAIAVASLTTFAVASAAVGLVAVVKHANSPAAVVARDGHAPKLCDNGRAVVLPAGHADLDKDQLLDKDNGLDKENGLDKDYGLDKEMGLDKEDGLSTLSL